MFDFSKHHVHPNRSQKLCQFDETSKIIKHGENSLIQASEWLTVTFSLEVDNSC